MENSIERIVPDMTTTNERTGNESLRLHMERYHFAGKHLREGATADIACGVGYGSFLLAEEYSSQPIKILAADNNAEVIEYAKKKYFHQGITFLTLDITKFIPPFKLQNIVCLETLEHLGDPTAFVNSISVYLESGALFIASVPITPSMDANPFHLHDFTKASFKKMFVNAGFKEIASMQQIQPYNVPQILFKKEKRTSDTRSNILSYYVTHPGKFFLRIRSVLVNGFCNKYMVGVFEKQ